MLPVRNLKLKRNNYMDRDDNNHPDDCYRGYWLIIATLMAAIGMTEILNFAKNYLETF